jgi:hypothetical protein
MLHYTNRSNRIFILTVDQVLATDIRERLNGRRGLESAELVTPGGNNNSAISVEDIEGIARDTLTGKVLIIDVRNQTRPMLQRAYSDIVRFNRPDFNNYCYSVLIGDGPMNMQNHKGIQAFQNYLCDLRVDFSPAVFFADPFLHYSFEEKQDSLLYNKNALSERMPRHLEGYFKGHDLTVRQIREYFRAAGVDKRIRSEKKKKRQRTLQKVFMKMIEKEFPRDGEDLKKALSREGCPLPGEPLRLNVYPFFFEKWVRDLFVQAGAATQSSHIA